MARFSRHPLCRALLCSLLAHGVLLLGPGEIRQSPPARAPLRLHAHIQVREVAVAADSRSSLRAVREMAVSAPLVDRGVKVPRLVPVAAPVMSAAAWPAGESAERVETEEVRRYRFALAIAARGFRPQSPILPAGNPEARVEVSVTMWRNSTVPSVSLHRSSGIALLDNVAMDMMKRAAQVAEVPHGMIGRDARIVLPLLFSFGQESPR